ncbi:MAG: GntR family transcriptional regulator [Burkholderiaceae bacterium]|nr:GntR family transcriptional regulator [Burkholderiaceae bacterium]
MEKPSEHLFQPLEREMLWDQVYVRLRGALLAGKYEPGARMVLRELADSLGTSITPVRDAVARLIAGGVLELGPRNTAIVPEVSSESFRHLTIVRIELEGRAAREAALRPDVASVARLEAQLAKMRSLIGHGDLDAYLDVHRQFHSGIYEMARMPILQQMIEGVWLRCGPVLSFVIPDYVRLLKGTDHHLRVLEALAKGNADVAEAEIVADIQEAGEYVLSLADDEGRIRRPTVQAQSVRPV